MYRDLNKGLPVEADAIVGGPASARKSVVSARPDLSAGARARDGPAAPVEKTVYH
jgi:hypothetical protein